MAYNDEMDVWGHHSTGSWYSTRPYLRTEMGAYEEEWPKGLSSFSYQGGAELPLR